MNIKPSEKAAKGARVKPHGRGPRRKPLVYEGRIRIFDPEPGDVIYLLDHPLAEGDWGPDLVSQIELWSNREIHSVGGPSKRLRITIEEIE